MIVSRSKRRTKDGIPIRYALIDESGHPYYDVGDVGPFAMGAVVTDDPESLAEIALSQYSNTSKRRKYWVEPGKDELKRSRSNDSVSKDVLNRLKEGDYVMLVVDQPMFSEADNPIESGSAVYAGTLSRLLIRLAELGPDGIYRVRLDSNDYVDKDMLELLAKSAFDENGPRVLAKRKPADMLESDLGPAIQTVDMMVGEYRRSLLGGDEGFTKRNGIIKVCNRKKR